MKIISLNKPVTGIIFDIDLTLYDNMDYYKSQTTLLVGRMAEQLGLSYDQMSRKVEDYQAQFKTANNGQEQSLGKILKTFGLDVTQNIQWRNELFEPEKYLKYNSQLYRTMLLLSSKFLITAVTNNTAEIARRTLKVLQLEEYFLTVIGLETSGEIKPSMIPFDMAAKAMHKPYKEIVSVGDRFAVDIDMPVKAGMNGILVESIYDVYDLPSILI